MKAQNESKQRNKKRTNYKTNKQIVCTTQVLCSDKIFLKLCSLSGKPLITLKCLSKIFFNMDITNLCFLP